MACRLTLWWRFAPARITDWNGTHQKKINLFTALKVTRQNNKTFCQCVLYNIIYIVKVVQHCWTTVSVFFSFPINTNRCPFALVDGHIESIKLPLSGSVCQWMNWIDKVTEWKGYYVAGHSKGFFALCQYDGKLYMN